MVARSEMTLWQYFDEEESDSKVMCRLCSKKLAYNHSTGVTSDHIQRRHPDINLQGVQATTTSTQQTSITTFATPTYRRCDADQSEKITQLITEMTVIRCHYVLLTAKASAT